MDNNHSEKMQKVIDWNILKKFTSVLKNRKDKKNNELKFHISTQTHTHTTQFSKHRDSKKKTIDWQLN